VATFTFDTLGIEFFISSGAILIALVAAYISYRYRTRTMYLQAFENIFSVWQSEEFTAYKKVINEKVACIKEPFPINHLEECYECMRHKLHDDYLERSGLDRTTYDQVFSLLRDRKDISGLSDTVRMRVHIDEATVSIIKEHELKDHENRELERSYDQYVIPMRRMTNFFEGLGVRWNHRYVDRTMVRDFIGHSVIRYWDILEPFITAEREWSSLHRYQENFHSLAEDIRKKEK